MKLLTFKDLHQYQVKVIAKSISIRYALLALDTGLGKTPVSLTIFDQLQKRGLVKKMLVVAPKKVVYNVWRQEAQVWAHTQRLKFSIIHGDALPGPAEASRRRGLFAEADVYLTTYETLPWLSYKLLPYLDRTPLPWQMIVYDESTKIKHTSTQRYKRWKPFIGKFLYRYALTGTPMPNGIQDLFGQMYAIDLGQSLGGTITSFRSRFLERIPASTNFAMYRDRPGAVEEVARRIKPHAVYLEKTDYLDMPPLKYNPIYVELPAKLRGMYDTFEKEFYLELDNVGIEAFNSGSLSMKLRQFLQGFVYDTNGEQEGKERRVVQIHSEKLDMLSEMVDLKKKKKRCLEGIGNTIIVYYFQYERIILQRLFPDAPFIDGSSKEKDVSRNIELWNNGSIPVLLANSASLNYGLNLQDGGNNIMWYTMTWNAEHFSQLIDRLWRQRQTKPVFVHMLLFRRTIEEVIFEAVKTKNAKQKDVLNAIKAFRNN